MPFSYFHIGEILLREIHLFHLKGLAVEIGQRPGVKWENTDRIDALKAALA